MGHLFFKAIVFYCCACVSLQAAQIFHADPVGQRIERFKATVDNLETFSDRNIARLLEDLDEIVRLQHPQYRVIYEAIAVMQVYQEDSSYCTWPVRLIENAKESPAIEQVLIERLQDAVENVWPKRK